MVSKRKPWAVIARKEDQRVALDSGLTVDSGRSSVTTTLRTPAALDSWTRPVPVRGAEGATITVNDRLPPGGTTPAAGATVIQLALGCAVTLSMLPQRSPETVTVAVTFVPAKTSSEGLTVSVGVHGGDVCVAVGGRGGGD